MDSAGLLPAPFAWVAIPTGPVTLEYGEYRDFQYVRQDTETLTVPAFRIGQYPVTNAQFSVFEQAPDGFTDPEWWAFSPAAAQWREENAEPVDIPRDNDRPAVYVSWYDALAYCGWLSRRSGQAITLPSEAQWQRAAQGDDGRAYPWGQTFEPERANTLESRRISTTLVTAHPNGVSPFGVWDMSGNVWEWTRSLYGPDDPDQVVLRGGSWRFLAPFARVTYRLGYQRDYPHGNFGFRIVSE